ncbi:hypothetical protein NKR23_g192 [Pleurostoma richardsiae]|uniref:Cell wall mannoprotein PIR1-like C-terminal domain-containing protein n=1 Tax=Pleurostoma richardsiae TaxID=41990 RepID=A0AA38SG70_9PEZI|nr:hypothetical protein NKR23_g192 [Pleurostoma richardsiae]
MKLPHVLYLVALDLPVVFAGAEGCCKFSLSSSGPFACPAGQLDDGQIRLNGTYSTSIFCIDEQGKITDEHGFGCIVTDPPTTQAQCDRDKAPGAGFSIGSDNMLLYNGSPSFFACPATDTEWNVYVAPNFGQPKCATLHVEFTHWVEHDDAMPQVHENLDWRYADRHRDDNNEHNCQMHQVQW